MSFNVSMSSRSRASQTAAEFCGFLQKTAATSTRIMFAPSNRTGGLSLTPCFSGVFGVREDQNRFNGFRRAIETVETVPTLGGPLITPLKQGVNERAVEITLEHRPLPQPQVAWMGLNSPDTTK